MFSIIVPVYNAVAHVERCIDSVLAQNYKFFELILVNDGSSDGSEVLIRNRYGSLHNVKLIEQGNAGVSVARNVGINHSTGQYLVFLDSDDWLENGYLQYVADLISSSPAATDGVVLSYFLSSFSTKTKFSYHKRRGVIGSDEYCRMFLDGRVSNHPWDKVFKRSLYIGNNIKFPEGVSLGEDAVVSAMLGFYSSSIYLSERAYLHYMQDTNGVTTRRFTLEKMIGLDKALSQIVELYSSRYNGRYLSKFYLFKFFKSVNLFVA
ncbi:MAG: glycosyltransferase family 2 protein [Cellvibrionaceae bacterium]|nr:glycosyltransferase family 2 protein [Cellvibrionaceae bacterium]